MDNTDKNQLKKIINEQKEELNEWKKNLINSLSNCLYRNEELLLISKFWLDNYEKYFLNVSNFIKMDPNTYEENKNTNNELLSTFVEPKIKLENLPRIVVLSKNIWMNIKNEEEETNIITSTGYFGNKILFLRVIEAVYCLFFLEKKDTIKQGYLQIINKNQEYNIINDLYQNGVEIFNKHKSGYSNNDYKFIILKKKENKKNDDFKIMNRPRAHTFFQPTMKPNEISLYFGNKVFNVSKNININVEEKMGEKNIDELFKKVLQGNKLNKALTVKENINNNIKVPPKEPKKSIETKTKTVEIKSSPGLIGLENIGATCYMNATLQCFSNIYRIKDYLIDEEIYQDLKKNKKIKKLSFALATVLYNLWKNLKIEYYKPEKFKKKISKMNPLFKGVAANDPKDLVLFLLQTLHKELNYAPNNKINNNYIANNKNFQEVLSEFIQNFNNENKSVISDEFYGCVNSMTTCGCCNVTIHNVQAINILFFPLEEVRKFKNYSYNCVKIEDCFDYYEKQEIYPSCFCNNCRQLYPAYNQSKIVYAPPSLIINLNRGRGLQFKVNIQFGEMLNLRNYIFCSGSPYMYELVGIICHFGSNDMGGHFIAYCKNNFGQWHKFNDSFVTPISFDTIMKDNGVPYVLFYSYIVM